MTTIRDQVINNIWDWSFDVTNEFCDYAYLVDIIDATDLAVNDIMFDARHFPILELNETSIFHT